jgi:hypothetical protein
MAWDRQFREGYLAWLGQSRKAWRNGLWVLFAVSLVGVLLAILYRPARYAVWLLAAMAAGSLVLQGVRVLGIVQPKGPSSRTKIQSTFSLSLARTLRTSAPLRAGFRVLMDHVTPAVFVVVLLVGTLLLLNRATFDLTSAAGRFCHGTPGLDLTKEAGAAQAAGVFRTSDMCWPSGLVLEKDHRYEITITTRDGWFDRQTQTDVLGMLSGSPRYILGAPLKRWWSANWFQPIARIGDVGNVEVALEPLDDTDTDRSTLRARIIAEADGELFLFVNDAVLSVPGLTETFMKNNSGTASVKIRRLGLRNSATR